MILYNTTFHIDRSIDVPFLAWLKEHFISQAHRGGFINPMLTSIRLSGDESDSAAYALHLYAETEEMIEKWNETYVQPLYRDMYRQWGEKAVAFSTMMQIIDLDL